jgi:hypothetical protein
MSLYMQLSGEREAAWKKRSCLHVAFKECKTHSGMQILHSSAPRALGPKQLYESGLVASRALSYITASRSRHAHVRYSVDSDNRCVRILRVSSWLQPAISSDCAATRHSKEKMNNWKMK